MDEWAGELDKGTPVDVAFLDFSKAFDVVPHKSLLEKVRSHGIQGSVLKWLQSFLTGRRQRVVVEEAQSMWRPVGSGVFQGSILGPSLFLLYINNLPSVSICSTKLFADDTKVSNSAASEPDCMVLQADIDAKTEWSEL